MVASKSIAVFGSLACAGLASAFTSYSFAGHVNFTQQAGWSVNDNVTGLLTVSTVTNPVNVGPNNETYTLTGQLTLQNTSHPATMTFNVNAAGVQDGGSPPSLITWSGLTAASDANFFLALRGGAGAQPNLNYPDPIDPSQFTFGTTIDVNSGTTNANTLTQTTITSFQAVPEPASIAAVGLGLITLVRKRRQRG